VSPADSGPGRLRERLGTFVDLSARVRSTCESLAGESEGGRRERCLEVAERAAELERRSRALLDRLDGLEGASRLRTAVALFLSRRQQREVADLAREVAGAFEELVGGGGRPDHARGEARWDG